MEEGNFRNFTDTYFKKLWEDARSRWLRPSEVYEILINNCRFPISKEPLNLPPSGTLVLFDRKMLRNFRRDGHPWRKKKDNKTVKEAHEHLKVGSEERIHVYYAHGEGDSNLQRRVYWLLDKALEHIVLVHYLEVKEAKTNTSLRHQPNPVQAMQLDSYTTYRPLLGLNLLGVQPLRSSASSAGPGSDPSLEFSELNSNVNEDFDVFSVEDLQSTGETGFCYTQLGTGFLDNGMSTMPEQVNQQGGGNVHSSPLIWNNTSQAVNNASKIVGQCDEHYASALGMAVSRYGFQGDGSQGSHIGLQGPHEPQMYAAEGSCLSTTIDPYTKSENDNHGRKEIHGAEKLKTVDLSSQTSWLENGDEVLKKLDSLDRWMQRELPSETKTSPLALSINSSCVLGNPMNEEKSIQDGAQPPLHSRVAEEMTPSFESKLYFNIIEYSPTWGFSSEDTKVMVVGTFNQADVDFDKLDWCCMFGDKELQIELVQMGVLKFTIPKDVAPGSILFYISNGIKQPCSDEKQFEVRHDWAQKNSTDAMMEKGYEDAALELKLAHLLLNSDHGKKSHKGSASMPQEFLQITNTLKQDWVQLINLLDRQCASLTVVKDMLLQLILKNLMVDSICKEPASEMRKLECFNVTGQTVLHLASALGYEWALGILKASGTSIDYRDKQGWTALHWAAYYGREKMVAALLAAGAKPGTISDPTPEHRLGCTPADIASLAGYGGLAGYLSERDLASHLECLTLAENECDKQSATDEGHRVIEYLRRSMSLRRSVKTAEDELVLEDSLSAIGNATVSAARIHAAFKEYFMRERLRAIEEEDEYGISVEEQMAVQKIQRAYRGHLQRKKKECAALQIQNRFRVWKTRKNFLKIRQNVIKIQAFYRMHRARKQYHKILWSAGVLEKAILRWKQRKKGLRGYQAETSFDLQGKDSNEFLNVGRKQAEEALDRAVLLVQSMARSKLARQQYRRMKENFDQAKVDSTSTEAIEEVMMKVDLE